MANIKYLIVDGESSGTGLRDPYESGYINPVELNLSPAIVNRLSVWLKEHESLHFKGFDNKSEISKLDNMGIELAKEIKITINRRQSEYFSAAELKKIAL